MASADTAQGRKSRACFRTFSGDSSSREPRLFLPPKKTLVQSFLRCDSARRVIVKLQLPGVDRGQQFLES